MGLTAFGVVWILVCLISFNLSIKYTASLIIVSCIFQAAAVILIGDRPIGPISVTEVFFITKCFFRYKISNHIQVYVIPKWMTWCILFFLFCTLASLFFPVFFEGIHVYPAQYGIDANYYRGGYPLVQTATNFVQIVILFFNLITLVYFYQTRNEISSNWLINSFITALIITIIIGFWSLISKTVGIIPFPDSFFYSGSDYGHDILIEDRIRLTATFIEASAAGQFLSAAFWAVFALKRLNTKIVAATALLALLLTFSSSGILGITAGLVIYVVLTGSKQFVSVAVFITIGAALLYLTGIVQPLIEMLVGKLSSQSGEVRTGADIFTYNLWLNTHFLGVGLGSHRTSSFLLNLLGAVGIVGVVLFAMFYFKLLQPIIKVKATDQNAIFILTYSLTLMSTQLIAAPDISLPIFWVGLFMAANYCLPKQISKTSVETETMISTSKPVF